MTSNFKTKAKAKQSHLSIMAAVAGALNMGALLKGAGLPDLVDDLPKIRFRSNGSSSHRKGYRPNENRCANRHPGVRNPKIAADVNAQHARWLAMKAGAYANQQ